MKKKLMQVTEKMPPACAAVSHHDYTVLATVGDEDCAVCNRVADDKFCPRHAFLLDQGITSRTALRKLRAAREKEQAIA